MILLYYINGIISKGQTVVQHRKYCDIVFRAFAAAVSIQAIRIRSQVRDKRNSPFNQERLYKVDQEAQVPRV